MAAQENIPSDAITVYYKAGRAEGTYSFWRRMVQIDGEWTPQWYWSALGNGGRADEVDEAKEAAKEWIKNRQMVQK
jgi:hypothetical protein